MNSNKTFFLNLILNATSIDKLNKLIETFQKENENAEKYELLKRVAKLKIFCIDRLVDPQITNRYLSEFYSRGLLENEDDLKKKIVIIEKIYMVAESRNLSLKKVDQLVLQYYDNTNYLEEILGRITDKEKDKKIEFSSFDLTNESKDKQKSNYSKRSNSRANEMNTKQIMILKKMAKYIISPKTLIEDSQQEEDKKIEYEQISEVERMILETIQDKMRNSFEPEKVK